jgi:hypothetical protein
MKSHKSVERFVSRMAVARTQKEENEKEAKMQIGSGNNWRNKVTVPKQPVLATGLRNVNSQLIDLSILGGA